MPLEDYMGTCAVVPNPTANLQRHETLPSGFLRDARGVGSDSTVFAGVGQTERVPD
jgi:hypothetical protein